MSFDKDLESIQEARDLARRARKAQAIFAEYTAEQVDRIIAAMAEAGRANAERLAQMAVDETKFGVYEDKITKNVFAATQVYEAIRDVKTVGVISEDPVKKTVEIGSPMGVVMGIVPSTNPTSTAIYKSLISLKGRNAVVFAPHPSAARCTFAAAEIMHEAAVRAGAPEGIIACLQKVSMPGTQELMKHPDIAIILATGGSAMVKSAYSVGKPAYGVGPGNVPAFIERTADIPEAVKMILASKTFDNGTICASEQAIVTEECIKAQVMAEFKRQGGYFLAPEEAAAMARVLITPYGAVNASLVGRSPKVIADEAGISIPPGTRVLIAELTGVGPEHPLSREKLSPVLGFYTEKDWHAACLRCIELLNFGGVGHSLVIHSQNPEVIMEFALKKPVFRILVNTPSSQGAIGFSTGLEPSLTLGCGTWGGSSTSDNVTPLHLINRKRLAYGIRDVTGSPRSCGQTSAPPGLSAEEIAEIVKRVLAGIG